MVNALEIRKQFLSTISGKHSGHRSSISPHAPYSVSPELFELIDNFPNNNLITIHNQESYAEDDFFKNRNGDFLKLYEKLNIDISFFKASGKSSLQTFLPYFKKKQPVILVHNVCTMEDDFTFIKNSQFRIPKIILLSFSINILMLGKVLLI